MVGHVGMRETIWEELVVWRLVVPGERAFGVMTRIVG
jgi:hypothetical protein